jgi:multidrug resistance efflux pump
MTLLTRPETLEPDMTATSPAAEPATADRSRPSEPTGKARFSRGLRKWRNRAIVVLMVVAAAYASVHLIRTQAARSAKLELGDVVLTAQPISVESAQSGVVTAVDVRAGDRVTSGQLLGSIDVTTTDTDGRPVIHHRVLRAPRAGVVVDDPVTVGSTLQAGVGFAELYDPAALRLVTSVPLSYLSRLRSGMSAELTAPGVPGEVPAVLQRAVPRVGSSDQDVPKGDLELVFVAKNPARIAKLIPGLRFHGTVDTRTGSGHAKPAEYVS